VLAQALHSDGLFIHNNAMAVKHMAGFSTECSPHHTPAPAPKAGTESELESESNLTPKPTETFHH
jgi:hypothetical protein